jgi:hypothetical protein
VHKEPANSIFLSKLLDVQNSVLKDLPIGIFKIEMHTHIVEFYNEEALKLIRGHDSKDYVDPVMVISQFAIDNRLTHEIRDHNILIKNFDYTLNVLSKPILIIPKQFVLL